MAFLRLFSVGLLSFVAACSNQLNDRVVEDFAQAMIEHERFDLIFDERAAKHGISRAAAVYISPDGTISEAYFGPEVGPNSLFQAASLSKTVTAAGVLAFARGRGIGIDEDIRPYITALDWEDIPGGTEPVSISSLLSHTAGATVSGFTGYDRSHELPSNIQIVKGQQPATNSAVRLNKSKGQFAYSGGGYQLAQLFVEHLTNDNFSAEMKFFILEPIGMVDSRYEENLGERAASDLNIAKADSGIRLREGVYRPLRNSWRNYPELAAAGLWTTPHDFTKFVVALSSALKGDDSLGIDPEIATLITEEVASGYARGVFIEKNATGQVLWFGHGGANTGYRSYFRVFPEDGSAILVFTNNPRGIRLIRELVASATNAVQLRSGMAN